MKFTATITLLGAISGVHGLVVPRDLQTVTGVFSTIQSNIDGLGKAFEGSLSDLAPLLAASNKLITSITDGTSTIAGGQPLTLIEAVKIIRPVRDLESHARTLVSTLKGKKPQIKGAGLCQVVSQQIDTIDTDSQALTKATVNKVPQEAQSVATKVAKGILDVLADAKNEFSGQNC